MVAPSTGLAGFKLLDPVDIEAPAPSSPAASAHMGRIKAMRCICCQLLGRQQQSITEVHHVRETRQARCDWLTIPACIECHRGPRGIHGDRTYLRLLQMGEFDLLARTLAIYVKEHVR